jgi:hypothetical protein
MEVLIPPPNPLGLILPSCLTNKLTSRLPRLAREERSDLRGKSSWQSKGPLALDFSPPLRREVENDIFDSMYFRDTTLGANIPKGKALSIPSFPSITLTWSRELKGSKRLGAGYTGKSLLVDKGQPYCLFCNNIILNGSSKTAVLSKTRGAGV